MSHRGFRVFGAITCFLIASFAFSATITIDPTTEYQTIEGWGASSNFWENLVERLPQEVREEAFDYVFSDLGSNILCIRLYSDFQAEEDGEYNWRVMNTQRMIVNNALERGNINKIWVKVSGPPGWMKDNGDARSPGHVLEEHYQDYADYLSAYIRGMREDYDITVHALSIFNEPGWSENAVNYESTSTTPEEYRDILKVVGETFERDNIDWIRFMGPEAEHITGDRGGLTAYLPVILADSVAASYLDFISTHQYGDQRIVYGTGGPDDWEGLFELASENDLPIWETEMFIGGIEMASEDIHEGLRVAILIWTAQTLGNVNAWHYWQYLHPDESDQNKSQGVIAITPRGNDFSVFPRYYVMKHWMKNVPEGAVRIEGVSDDENLYVTAYQTEGVVTVIAFNKTENEIECEFNLAGIISEIEHIQTDEDQNYVDMEAIEPSESGFRFTAPQYSIHTFVIPVEEQSVDNDTPPIPELLSLDSYPNPFNSSFRVNYQLSARTRIALELYALNGAQVWSAPATWRDAGTHQTFVNAVGLASGVYLVMVETRSGTALRKVVLIR